MTTPVRFFARAAALIAGFAALPAIAFAQIPPLMCTASAAVPPQIRSEGLTELVGDIVLNCTGGTPTANGTAVPQMNITVYLNAVVTNRITAEGWADAFLLADEPAPAAQRACATSNGICSISGTGTGTGTYSGAPARPNVFQGSVTANAVTFASIPVDPPGQAPRIFRITGIRINATALAPADPVTQAVATVSIMGSTSVPLNNPTQVVGFAQPGVQFRLRSSANNADLPAGGAPFAQCTPVTNNRFATLQFRENFGTAFKVRVNGTQNQPGEIYLTESGFNSPGLTGPAGSLAAAGLADAGTQLKLSMTNIPSGTALFVSTVPVTFTNGVPSPNLPNPKAQLVLPAGNPVTLDGLPAMQVPVLNNKAAAVWEVVAPDPLAAETYYFSIWISTSGSASGTAVANGSLGPISSVATADVSAPVPRFAGTATLLNLFTLTACQPIIHTPDRLPNATAGSFYAERLQAQNGLAPYSWSLAPGSTMPPGLTLRSDGVVINTPTTPGTYTFTVRVTDNQPASADKAMTLTVSPPGAACSFLLTPVAPPMYPAIAGGGLITVTSAPGCYWAAASGASWITITSDSFGYASGIIVYAVGVNAGAARSGTITVAGQAYLIRQAGSTASRGDINGDGGPDLIWHCDTSRQATVHFYGGAQGAVFQGWSWLYSSGAAGWRLVAAADFDGNGVPDAVWMNDTTRQVTVHYFGGAQGVVFQGWNWLNAGGAAGWTVVAAADMDSNGTPDLVWQNDATRQVTVHYYGGTQGAAYQGWSWLNSAGVAGWRIAAVADFDGNGTPDLLWQNDAGRQVTVHYYGGTQGAVFQGWQWLNAAGVPGWAVAGASDFDRNGTPDLVWQNDTTRQATVHYYGGTQGAAYQGWNWMNSTGVAGWRIVIPR